MSEKAEPVLEPLLLTADEVAALLGVDPQTVRRRAARGEMPKPIRLGRRSVRWRRETIERWIADVDADAQRD